MRDVLPCQVPFDCYGKREEKLGAFLVNRHLTSSQSYRGLLNCEYNSLATLVYFLCFV